MSKSPAETAADLLFESVRSYIERQIRPLAQRVRELEREIEELRQLKGAPTKGADVPVRLVG